MGALTSKPYAFRGRPWETKNLEFFDLFSPIYSPLRLDIRGLQILRILPRYSNWITDQARFSYDSFKIQRLINPLIIDKLLDNKNYLYFKHSESKTKFSSWITLFMTLRSHFIKHFSLFHFFLGRFSDYTTFSNLNSFSISLGGTVIMGDHFEHDEDLPSLVFSPQISSVSDFSSILLFNSDIRLESPILAAQLRQHPCLYSFGIASSLSFPSITISIHFQNNPSFLTGKHLIWKNLITSNSFLIINGIQLVKSHTYFSSCNKYLLTFLDQLSKFKWKGNFSLLSLIPSLTAYNKLSFLPPFRFNVFKIFFLIESESLKLASNDFVVYYGSHNSQGVKQAEIIFPGILPLERQDTKFYFISSESSKFSFILPSPFGGRSLPEVLSTLTFFFGMSLIGDFLNSRKLNSFSSFNNFLFNNPKLYFLNFNNLTEFKSSNWNNFRTNVLVRKSRILSLAARRFESEIRLTIF